MNPNIPYLSRESKLRVFTGLLAFAAVPLSLFSAVSWDGGAADGVWTSPLNWSADAVPASGDDVTVGLSATVTGATADFASLAIESGASVAFTASNPAGKVFDIDGTLDYSGAFRPYGSALNLSSTGSIGSNLSWLDLGTSSSMSFVDGASFATATSLELRGATTFGFELSSTGFSPLSLGTLWDSGISGWNELVINIDVSAYDTANGAAVVLMDFASHNGDFAGTFNPTINVAAGASGLTGTLSFNTSTSELIYTFDVVVPPVTWDGEAGDGLWTSVTNWDADSAPSSFDEVIVGSSAVVTAATVDFASLEIQSGASVVLNSAITDTLTGKILIVDGSFGRDPAGVLRLYGNSQVDVSGSGSFASSINFFDLGGTTVLNFTDGASFGASNINFQLRNTPTLGFELSTTGFTTIQLGGLYDPASWSDVTFNVDLSAYDTANGLSVELMDFSSHSASLGGTFDPTVNIIDGGTGLGGQLFFNTTTSVLSLTLDPAGNDAPVAADQSFVTDGVDPLAITLSAYDIEGDPLMYSIVSGPSHGSISGTPPNITYTYTGSNFEPDSFTYKANDTAVDSNIATVSIIPVPRTVPDLWGSLQSNIENDALNAATHTTWTVAHSDGSGDTITISRVTYELGTLDGTQHTATPVIAAYYARPTGETNLPGLIQIHGGGQFASSGLAQFWAEQGYAAISINWGGQHLEAFNTGEPDAAVGEFWPNTNWDGLAAGFYRIASGIHPVENEVVEALHKADVDPAIYSDGQTLYDIPHPLNSSWALNGYAGRRAITYLQSLAEVDDSKIGVLGWSMGGRTTVMTSTDPRLTVIAPGVGGSGFLYEDWWAQPGTARSSHTWQDIDLYKNTVDAQSYWPNVSAPAMFLEAANDFNAPFDLVMKALSLHETNLNVVSPENIFVSAPHYNHRLTDTAVASRVHWMRHHLKGDVEFPGISNSDLQMTTDDGIPLFKVYPDTSTSLPIASVEIYYGIDRDSRTRFWRDAGAVDMGTHWEAQLPLFDLEEMMAVYAIVTYDIGFTQTLTPGSGPTNLFDVASQVHTYYPTGVDTTGYSLPADLDTDIHKIHHLSPSTLVANGLRETAEITAAIDDPSSSRGFEDWFLINAGNPVLWQVYTRKISDPSYRGGVGAQFTFDLTADAVSTLVVKLNTEGWNEGATNTYYAYVPIVVGLNQVSLSVSDFKWADTTTALTTWDTAKFIGFGSGQGFSLDTNGWAGSFPVIANLAWSGGYTILDNGISTTWLSANGLPLSNDATLQDSDGDNQLNWEEHDAGTDPVDPNSVLKVESSTVSAGGDVFLLNWQGVSGKSYAVDYKEHLTDALWVEIPDAAGVSGVEPTTSIEITLDSEQSTGFFRVRLE